METRAGGETGWAGGRSGQARTASLGFWNKGCVCTGAPRAAGVVLLAARPTPLGRPPAGCPELPAPFKQGLPHLPPVSQLQARRDTRPSFSETQASVPRPPLPQRRAPATQRPPKEPGRRLFPKSSSSPSHTGCHPD